MAVGVGWEPPALSFGIVRLMALFWRNDVDNGSYKHSESRCLEYLSTPDVAVRRRSCDGMVNAPNRPD